MSFDIHIYHYFPGGPAEESKLADILRGIHHLTKGQANIMATLDELVAQTAATKDAVVALKTSTDKIPAAVDALEAAVTAAIANAPISAANQAKIDAAFENLNNVATDVTDSAAKLDAAAADAADGVDEAAQP